MGRRHISGLCRSREKTLFQKEALSHLSFENAVKYNAIPLYMLGSTITVATDRPNDQDRIQALRMVSGKLVSPKELLLSW